MALADALHGLLRLPGATYSCVVERDTGRVLAEVGHGGSGAGDGEGVVPYSVARWGTAVAAMFDSTSGDGLDDVMITGRRSYHLVRPLGATATVLVYLRLDRARSNLAAARRELAGVRWGNGVEARTSGVPASVASESGAPGSGALGSGALGSGALGSGAPGSGAPGSGAPGSGAPGSGGQDRAVRVARRPVRPGDDVAAPRASPGGTPVREVVSPPHGSARSLPVAADEEGAPVARRAATEPRPPTARPQPGLQMPGPQVSRPQIPLPRRAPAVRSSDPGARRRGAGRQAGSGESSPPEGFVVPAVLGQSWARDPGTLRRLIAGLRRMP